MMVYERNCFGALTRSEAILAGIDVKRLPFLCPWGSKRSWYSSRQ